MNRKYNLEQVKTIVENEGLGYAIQSYLGYEQIENKELSALWKQAKDAFDAIDKLFDNVDEVDAP